MCELRKVVINIGLSKVPGFFHVWGMMEYLADDGRDFPITCAIVELHDGSIRKVDPKDVKFEEQISQTKVDSTKI